MAIGGACGGAAVCVNLLRSDLVGVRDGFLHGLLDLQLLRRADDGEGRVRGVQAVKLGDGVRKFFKNLWPRVAVDRLVALVRMTALQP